MEDNIIIVGCGISGAVLAERFANVLKKRVLIIDKRDHIGGNCYDYIDEETGILCNKYGPHFFHTKYEDVWEYINKFGEWIRYDHKVIGNIDNKLFPIPVNINTVNILCNENIKSEEEMYKWLENNQIKFDNIDNGEKMAKSRVGNLLYDKIFKNYTYKQWNKYPEELKPEVLARIPIRSNFDDRYFDDKYQVLPKNGYTSFFTKLLDSDLITIKLNTDYFDIKDKIDDNKIVIYTGPIDRYFSDIGFEKLEYRSLNFKFERYKNMNYYQTHTTVNYPNLDKEFTRITEYKHCYNTKSNDTIICKEYGTNDGEPYYPILNDRNIKLYNEYQKLALEESKKRNIHFIGRLANYKYFNMDQAIKNALDYFNKYLHI